MNRFFLAVLITLCVLLYTLPALAVEDDVTTEEPSQEPVIVETDDKNIIVNVTLPALASPVPTEELPPVEESTPPPQTFIPFSAYSLDVPPETSPETISAVVTALFGEYTLRTQTVTDRLSDGTTVTYTQVIPGLAGLDYPWLSGVGLFALFLYGFLRLIGGLIKL